MVRLMAHDLVLRDDGMTFCETCGPSVSVGVDGFGVEDLAYLQRTHRISCSIDEVTRVAEEALARLSVDGNIVQFDRDVSHAVRMHRQRLEALS